MKNFDAVLPALLAFLQSLDEISSTEAVLTRKISSVGNKEHNLKMYSFYIHVVIIQMRQVERACQSWRKFLLSNKNGFGTGEISEHLISIARHDLNALRIRQVFEKRLSDIERITNERRSPRQNALQNAQTWGFETEETAELTVSDLQKYYDLSCVGDGEICWVVPNRREVALHQDTTKVRIKVTKIM